MAHFFFSIRDGFYGIQKKSGSTYFFLFFKSIYTNTFPANLNKGPDFIVLPVLEPLWKGHTTIGFDYPAIYLTLSI